MRRLVDVIRYRAQKQTTKNTKTEAPKNTKLHDGAKIHEAGQCARHACNPS